MMNAIGIALSGVLAATRRINVAASNIVNAQSAGASDRSETADGVLFGQRVYQPKRVLQTSGPSGVSTQTVPAGRAPAILFTPDNPAANEAGFAAFPTVDNGTEFAEILVARQAFAASLKIIQAVNETTGRLLDDLS